MQIWSDVACPWCFIGKRRLEAAARAEGLQLVVTWHSFELDPRRRAPEMEGLSYVERLAKKYGVPASHAQSMIDQMTSRGHQEGIEFHFEKAIPANTFDAHRVLHWAKHVELREGRPDLQDQTKERLLTAHLCEGQDVADANCLARLAEEVGLDGERVSALLASNDLATEVRADETTAMELEVRGVPFFVIGRYAVGGAQPEELFGEVLQKALTHRESRASEVPEEAACGPNGC